MDASDKSFPDLVHTLKSWIPWRSEPANVSRDFWMPDQSCRVCYECDSQFTLFNRRHHCRFCGRVFCAKCTANWVPAPSSEPRSTHEECEKIRVCNYCFNQWEQSLAAAVTVDDGVRVAGLEFNSSPSATSFISTKSSGTPDSSSITLPQSAGSYQHNHYTSGLSPHQSAALMEAGRGDDPVAGDRSPNQFGLSMNRFFV